MTRACVWSLGLVWMEEVGQRDPSARTIVSNHWSQVDILVFMGVVFPGFVAKVCAGSVHV